MDIEQFLLFKTSKETQDYNDIMTENFSFYIDIKKNKKFWKKPVINILKNHKIQNKKEHLTNKINLILNKLSESNIDNLIIELLENIGKLDNDNYDELQKSFFIKIISEINFVNLYLIFLKTINCIYNKLYGYNLSFFVSLIENKFKLDYLNIDLTDKYQFILDYNDEVKRKNNLILINELIELNIFNTQLYNECDNIIINQIKYIPDIYNWFIIRNKKLTEQEIIRLHEIIKLNINPREKILLENLLSLKIINKKTLEKSIPLPTTNKIIVDNSNNKFEIECDNILEEYILLNSIDEIIYFIDNKCNDNTKNIFNKVLINKYNKNKKDLSILIKDLIKLNKTKIVEYIKINNISI